jgi:trans-aconitate methyltransferase
MTKEMMMTVTHTEQRRDRPATRSVISSRLVAQFRRPTGVLGRLAGWIMATRQSNRARNAWLVNKARIADAATILELGCGPGLALAYCLNASPHCRVTGIDHSEVMLKQAAHRNAAGLRDGRLTLRALDLRNVGLLGTQFDRIISANVLQFLGRDERREILDRLRPLLADGGMLATLYQPRHRGAMASDAEALAAGLAADMRSAGYCDVVTATLALAPVPAVCIKGSVRRG